MATKEQIREKEKQMSDEVIGTSPAGVLEKIPNLKKRQRSIYWREVPAKGGSKVWIQTQLLPSDAQGRELYLSKGFRLSPPSAESLNTESFDESKDALIKDLQNQLKMANARAERGKKEETF